MRAPRPVAMARGVLLGALVVAGSSLLVAAPASAHVTVSADEAQAGGTARVVFRMPNEADSPATRLEVHFLPEGAPPIASALTTPVPGWAAEVTYEDLDEPATGAHGEEVTRAVSVITWTAEDEAAGIQPGEFGEFPVEIGPLPEAEELYFPAIQTYVGVEEPVRWISRPDPDGGEPPDPAPVLRLSPAGTPDESGDSAGEPAGAGSAAGSGAEGENASADGGTNGAGVWLGLAGLVAGLGGLALGGVAFIRTRS